MNNPIISNWSNNIYVAYYFIYDMYAFEDLRVQLISDIENPIDIYIKALLIAELTYLHNIIINHDTL